MAAELGWGTPPGSTGWFSRRAAAAACSGAPWLRWATTSLAEFASSRRSPEAGTSAGPITSLALILGARKTASSDCSNVVSPM
ncbi:hypothetical protein D3C72_1359990 [compost metagenome]